MHAPRTSLRTSCISLACCLLKPHTSFARVLQAACTSLCAPCMGHAQALHRPPRPLTRASHAPCTSLCTSHMGIKSPSCGPHTGFARCLHGPYAGLAQMRAPHTRLAQAHPPLVCSIGLAQALYTSCTSLTQVCVLPQVLYRPCTPFAHPLHKPAGMGLV